MRRPAVSGFTLIEILMALVVMAVLMSLAAPSLTKMVLDNRLRSQSADLLTNLAIARSEAAKRGVRVTICASTTYASATPSCTAGGQTAWNRGYIMFADQNGNGAFDAGSDVVLKISDPLSGGNTLATNGFSAPAAADRFQYRPSGSTNLPAAGGFFRLCDNRAGATTGRQIQISISGRPVSVTPTTACPFP